ncbi:MULTISPECIES: Stealth CR1 domain-containing protein [unclassified Halorhodospira]|uniref:Stealth CR1 domain-containing protein n=1 Tax=unclassified Halorhodospira TaxID=2626748 RepID=UPI001EE90636|nr:MULTISPECIES: Stealth CR1 domain-containing protein [unclassified Halorhodospira]MCG5540144.1 Stealth CR1 domain-containing protein [Halorhodospira sp. M39old]MCG5545155.1 Stealth CR1 domain-containing protein [Halorhodospira sp. M38]
MIDAVITWVDGDDPGHAHKRAAYAKLAEPGRMPAGLDESRFRTSFELYYCVHLIRRHMDWIDRIHLVTDGQRPEWLSDKVAQGLGLAVVDHSTIFRGFEDVLPVFNSKSIEAVLHRIPGLAPAFLYFNDDIFVLRPTPREAFFTAAGARWRGRFHYGFRLENWVSALLGAGGVEREASYLKPGREREFLGRKITFQCAHSPHPFFRDVLADCFAQESSLRHQIAYRFRSHEQMTIPNLVANAAFMRGAAVWGRDDWGYVHGRFDGDDAVLGVLERVRCDAGVRCLCVQEADQMTPLSRLRVERLLADALSRSRLDAVQ